MRYDIKHSFSVDFKCIHNAYPSYITNNCKSKKKKNKYCSLILLNIYIIIEIIFVFKTILYFMMALRYSITHGL